MKLLERVDLTVENKSEFVTLKDRNVRIYIVKQYHRPTSEF